MSSLNLRLVVELSTLYSLRTSLTSNSHVDLEPCTLMPVGEYIKTYCEKANRQNIHVWKTGRLERAVVCMLHAQLFETMLYDRLSQQQLGFVTEYQGLTIPAEYATRTATVTYGNRNVTVSYTLRSWLPLAIPYVIPVFAVLYLFIFVATTLLTKNRKCL